MPIGKIATSIVSIALLVVFASGQTPSTTNAQANPVPCTMSLPHDSAIEIVVDLYFSPKMDPDDVVSATRADCGGAHADASHVFYDNIATFIDLLTAGVNVSQTYVSIIDDGGKYYLHGRPTNVKPSFATKGNKPMTWPSEEGPNYKPLLPQTTGLGGTNSQNNSLGIAVKYALLARENGLPVLLSDSKSLATAFTVIITDTTSMTAPADFTSDTSRTTYLAIGNQLRNNLPTLSYADFMQFANFVQLDSPCALLDLVNATRYVACLIASL